jgi:hypothetical protein
LKGGEDNEGQNAELHGNMLSKQDLKCIQKDIKNTIRPTWQTPPPSNFGSPSHGKLKADIWRIICDFFVTVSLVKMWLKPNSTNRQKLAAVSTLLLASAIRVGTSGLTSGEHAEEYTKLMETYLTTIRELRPNKNLHPIHHNALHFAEFLHRFGPSHGWWMFPFERLIGKLQQIHTNNKLGEHQARLLYIQLTRTERGTRTDNDADTLCWIESPGRYGASRLSENS